MTDGFPLHGQSNGLEPLSAVWNPDSERSRSSLEVEKPEADAAAQEHGGGKAQHTLPAESQIPLSGLNSSFSPADPLQHTFSSLASPIATNKANAEAQNSVVEDNPPFTCPILGSSRDANYRHHGVSAFASPSSEIVTGKTILEEYEHHDPETLDDIRFPEYFSSPNDEAQSSVESQAIQPIFNSLEWANEASEEAAKGSNQDTKHLGDETVKVPEDHSPLISPAHHSRAVASPDPSFQFEPGVRAGRELLGAEAAVLGKSPQNDYFSEKDGGNVNSSEQWDGYKSGPSLATDEDARLEEDFPTSSAQDGSTAQLNLNGHRSVSPTWFHGTKEDLPGQIATPSQPWSPDFEPLPQILDPSNHSAHNSMPGDSDRVDQAVPEEIKGSSTNTASFQRDVDSQATSMAPENEGISITKESQEEDLAAKWRAALGDDDFLEDESLFDPSSFFQDDGEGFLDDNLTQNPEVGQSSGGNFNHARSSIQATGELNTSSGAYERNKAPASSISRVNSGPTYVSHHNLSTTSSPLIQSPSPNTPPGLGSTGFKPPQDQPAFSSNATFPTRPQIRESAQSFSDKSKGGYTSPYDLPMEITRPKKRPYIKQTQTASEGRASSNPPPPPPRSSSINSAAASPVVDSYPVGHNNPNINAAPNNLNPLPPLARAASEAVTSGPSAGSFFEELPFTKPRPPSNRSKPVSGSVHSNPAAQTPFQAGPPHHSSFSQRPASSLPGNSPGYQLVPPERMALFSHAHEESSNKVPAIQSRYSPAPTSQNIIPPVQNRYASSSSVPRPHQPPHSMSFQPRKSSPLAQGNSVSQHRQRSSAGDVPRPSHQGDNIVEPAVPHSANIPENQEHRGFMQVNHTHHAETEKSSTISPPRFAELAPSENRYAPVTRIPSKSQYAPQQATNMDPTRSSFEPINAFAMSNDQRPSYQPTEVPAMEPPRRSQTQSPGAARPKPGLPFKIQELVQRPASTNQAAPVHSRSYVGASYQEVSRSGASYQEVPRGGQAPRPLNYIVPTDGRERDPLERWKGCPIFAFGFGGLTVTSFPKQIPRYSAGQTTPMIKCSPGEVKLTVGKTLRLDESLATFPGPLKSKGKKKDVLDWLKKRITHMENLHIPVSSDSISVSLQKRSEEQILLWKFLHIIVEHDGAVEGNFIALTAMRSLLTPEVVAHNSENLSEHSWNEGVGISMHDRPMNSSVPSNPDTLELIRRLLLRGEREKAVWCAVDQGMWDHAMLLSSTLQPDVWKQVLREFVRQKVRKSGSNTESLASLYQVFAGNWEESIDELVPPSARAGLQMVRMGTGASPPKNALEGLDKWRETLSLILNNRSQNDTNALVALGQLLSNYGRTEAAHICYLFGKTPGLFGGVDDPRVAFTLLGADHHNYPVDYDRDFNSILLTEVYEFATTVLAPSTMTGSPHLQAYKLYHAMQLAEYGFKSEAQQYCDTITTALKSITKLSPYYHSLFFGILEDLVERLRQAPKGASQSWISKPSMDKVSGSVWAKLNQFIAGDESDTNSAGSGKALDQDLNGPFAKVSGDSPSLSRTPSFGDIHSGYHAGGGIPRSAPTNIPNSRYASTGPYAPRPSLEQSSSFSQEPRQQSENEGRRVFKSNVKYQPQQSSPTETQHGSPSKSYKSPRQTSTYSPQSQPYLPTPPFQAEYIPSPVEDSLVPNNRESDLQISYLEPHSTETAPPIINENSLNTNSYFPPPDSNQSSSVHEASAPNTYPPVPNTEESPPIGYIPPSYTYEPPSNSYEPPSYDPETNADDDPESPQEKPKKKIYGAEDDDEEFVKSAAAVLKEERARRDREADEAFRKAAEADGKLSSQDFAVFNRH